MRGITMRLSASLLLGLLLLVAWPLQAEVRYIHTDALGSVVAVTDEQGNVIERREYEPYGAQLTPALKDGPGYTGHVQDAATGLVYMQQRYYDPGIGRFLSVDPVTANGNSGGNFNRYWYANNNPYRFTDPDGRWAEDLFIGIPSIIMGVKSGYDNIRSGNYGAATVDAVGVVVDAAAIATPFAPGGAGLAIKAGRALDVGTAAKTVTRYMGPGEAKAVANSGAIPNVGVDGIARPTHVTTDSPVSSASEAMNRYELPTAPTHSATVPANRVNDLGATPDGRSVTSGGGSQNATNQPIPVKPKEIMELGP